MIILRLVIWLAMVLALFAEPPRLYVVAAVDTVMPGQMFTITITAFGDVGDVTLDTGGLEVLTDTLGLPTRYVWLRADGPARDVRVRAWGDGIASETWIRVCCKESAPPANPTRRVYLPVFRH